MATFSQNDLLAISKVFGENASESIADTELAEIFDKCNIAPVHRTDGDASISLFEALKLKQSEDGNRRGILAFLRVAMDPRRYRGAEAIFDTRRQNLNEALMLCGIEVGKDGSLRSLKGPDGILIKRLWKGDIPLVQVYWLYGVLGNILLAIPGQVIEHYSQSLADSTEMNIAFAIVILLYTAFVYSYSIFILVSVWRSANRYSGPAYWATAAKCAVFLGVTALILGIVSQIYPGPGVG